MLTLDDVRLPRGWSVMAGGDTGTYLGGVICFLDPKPAPDIFVIEEICNYHYVGDGTIEQLDMTVSEWIRRFGTRLRHWTGQRKNPVWVDANTTFKSEVGHGVYFKMNHKHLELRTEVTREYNRNRRIHLMPWLTVLPYEMQEAAFPEHESTGSGRLVRIKRKDHVLDGLEHVCSRRPAPDFELGKVAQASGFQALLQQYAQLRPKTGHLDIHLGQN